MRWPGIGKALRNAVLMSLVGLSERMDWEGKTGHEMSVVMRWWGCHSQALGERDVGCDVACASVGRCHVCVVEKHRHMFLIDRRSQVAYRLWMVVLLSVRTLEAQFVAGCGMHCDHVGPCQLQLCTLS